MRALSPLACLALGACAAGGENRIETYQPDAGANIVHRGEIVAAPGHELVTGDLVLGAHAEVARHYHHGEEFIYVLGGSVVLYRPGVPDLTLSAGDALRIPPGTVHSAKAGPQGLRAVSNWVVPQGKPLREPVPD